MSKKQYSRGSGWSSEQKRKKTGSFKLKVEKILSTIFMGKKISFEDSVKYLVLGGFALFFAGSIIFLGMFAWFSRDLPDPNTLTLREIPQSTKIYDRTGEVLLYEIAGSEKRTLVTLEEIPPYVQHATITAEDRKFYSHNGFDIKGIIRALVVNTITLDPTGQGASTITQQLVKNAILTNEKTYTRKLKELVLSLALERRYTKDEILQLYLNEIPYGSTNYGIESAARAYYNKPAAALTLAEAATLASLPKAPTTFLNNPDRLKERRDWILNSMEELDFITEEERDIALQTESPLNPQLSGIKAPHFVLWVKEQLEQEYGERTVEQGGLEVITTIDAEKQEIAERVIAENVEERGEIYGFNNSALVSMDPNNGEILAMVGSADYFNDEINGKVNVTLRPLQPGSSFKPIVYAAAFEKGYTPNTLLWDVNTTFPSDQGPYEPKNFDFEERGPITIRGALQGSLNIPAVKALALIGLPNAIDFSEKLGYTTFSDRSRFGLAFVLGGGEVFPLEHASAYSVFANEGTYYNPVAILSVKDSEGETLYEQEEQKGENVLDANIARMVSNVLSDNGARAYVFGLSSYLQLPGIQVAAKTGTTNDSKDAWTVGYTPDLVTVVWGGNTQGTTMNRGAGGSTVAAPAWNSYMSQALANQANRNFTAPSIPSTGKAVLDGVSPSQTVIIDEISGKLATEYTPEEYKVELTCGEYHSILHYVDPADPAGPIPNNPGKNGYYNEWESSIETFIANHNQNLEEGEVPYENCAIPTEYDDVHTPENQPNVSIRQPNRNSSHSGSVEVEIRANGRRSLSRVDIYFDGQLAESRSYSENFNVSIPAWVNSSTQMTIYVVDDVGNSSNDSVFINAESTSFETGYRITSPIQNQIIEFNNEPFTIALEGSGAERVIVQSVNTLTGATETISIIDNPSGIETIAWNISASGRYTLKAITESSGNNTESPLIRVTTREKTVIEEVLEETTE